MQIFVKLSRLPYLYFLVKNKKVNLSVDIKGMILKLRKNQGGSTKLMIFFLFLENIEFPLRYDTDTRTDYYEDVFKCVHTDEKISLKKYNDGICDCCDGSDEYENPDVTCKNTCNVNIEKFNEDFVTYYMKAVNLSALNRKKSIDLLNEINEVHLRAESDLLYWQNEYQNAKNQKALFTRKINEITMDILNISIEEQTDALLDTLLQLFSLSYRKNDSENNDNGTSLLSKFSNSKKDSSKKKTASHDDNIKDALTKAYDTRNFSVIRDIGEYLEKNEKADLLKNTTYAKYMRARELKQNMETLINEDAGPNDEWREYTTGSLRWHLENTKTDLVINNMRKATISRFGLDTVYKNVLRVGELFIFSDDKGAKVILKPVCFSSLLVFGQYMITSMKQVFVFGTPVVCPPEAEYEGLNDFYREIQYYL